MCDSAFDISAPLPRSAFDIWFPTPVNFHYRTHLADSLLWQNSAFRFVSIPSLAFPHCADLQRNLEFVKHSFKGLLQLQIVLYFPANKPKEALFFILQQSTAFAQNKKFQQPKRRKKMYIASMQCNAMQWINSKTMPTSKFAFFVMKNNLWKVGFLCHRLRH